MRQDELITYIDDQIEETGDRVGTPIFRIENKFCVYYIGEQLEIHNKYFEGFLLRVSE